MSIRAGGDGLDSGGFDLFRKWRQDTDADLESRQEDARILDTRVRNVNFQLDNLMSERSRMQAEKQRLSDLIMTKAEEAESYENDLKRLEIYMRANDVNIGLIKKSLAMARDCNAGLKRRYLEFLKAYNKEQAEEEEKKRERCASLQSMFMDVETSQMESAQLEAELRKLQQINKSKNEAIRSARTESHEYQLAIERAEIELENKKGEISAFVERADEDANPDEVKELREQQIQMQEKAKNLMKEKNKFLMEEIELSGAFSKMKAEVERFANALDNQNRMLRDRRGQADVLAKDTQALCGTKDEELQQARRRLAELSSQLVGENNETCKLEAAVEELKSVCNGLNVKIADQERIVSDLTTGFLEMEHLEEDLRQARVEAPRVDAQETNMREQIGNLRQGEMAVSCLQAEKKFLEDEHRAVVEDISRLGHAVQAKGEQAKTEEFAILSSMKNDLDRAKSELENESQIIDEEEAEEEELKTTVMKMDESVKAMEAAGCRRLQIIEDKKKQLLFQLASENKALEVEINNVKSEAKRLELEHSNGVRDANTANTVQERTVQEPRLKVTEQKDKQSSGSSDSDDSDIFRLFSSPKKMTPEKPGKKFFKKK